VRLVFSVGGSSLNCADASLIFMMLYLRTMSALGSSLAIVSLHILFLSVQQLLADGFVESNYVGGPLQFE
jgi:hypothetical protein